MQTDPSQNGRWVASVVQRFEQPLVRYALSIIGSLEPARDVVQETFLELCRAKSSGREPPHELGPWLYKVCRNRAIDVRRKEQRMRAVSQELFARQEPCVADECDTTGEGHEVRTLVAGLVHNQQEVVKLRFEHGLSYREISEVMGLTVTNVGYLLHAAIQNLRKQMNRSTEPRDVLRQERMR